MPITLEINHATLSSFLPFALYAQRVRCTCDMDCIANSYTALLPNIFFSSSNNSIFLWFSTNYGLYDIFQYPENMYIVHDTWHFEEICCEYFPFEMSLLLSLQTFAEYSPNYALLESSSARVLSKSFSCNRKSDITAEELVVHTIKIPFIQCGFSGYDQHCNLLLLFLLVLSSSEYNRVWSRSECEHQYNLFASSKNCYKCVILTKASCKSVAKLLQRW